MEWVATLSDQISAPADAGREALAALRAELGAVGEALRALPALPEGLKIPPRPLPQLVKPKADPVAGGRERAKVAAAFDDSVARGDDKRAAERVKAIEKWNALKGKEADKYQAKYLKDRDKEAAAKAKPKRVNQLEELNKTLEGAKTLAKVGAAVSFGRMVGELAIGYRGMAQMQALTARAQYNFRMLFSGVNPAPLVRAYDRFLQNFSKASVTGQALSGIFERAFNGIFGLFERAEPYITAFMQSMLIAFLTVETAILRVRIALVPYQSALESIVSSSSLLKVASIAGSAAFVGAAAYATVAAAPFLALAAAILAVAAAFEQATKLAAEWDSESAGQIWRKIKSDVGLGGSQADKDREQGISTGAEYDAIARRKALAAEQAAARGKGPVAGVPAAGAGAAAVVAGAGGTVPPVARAAGQQAGAAMGAGFVAGMKGTEDAVAKGGAALAGSADTGLKTQAKIKSPSGLMRERGHQMGEGAALGMEDSSKRVEAAGEALVPGGPGAAGAGAKGGAGGGLTVQQIGPFYFSEGMGSAAAQDLEQAIRRGINDAFEAVAIRLGVDKAVIQ